MPVSLPHVSPLGPTLQTTRLILRPPVAEDFDHFAAFCADADVMRHIGGVMPRSVAWRAFRTMAGAWALDGFSMFSVIERETGAWIGRIGPIYPEGWPGREVGWGLCKAYWGRGIATEAAAAAMDFAFDVLGWDDVIHTIDVDNPGSQGVARVLGSVNRGPGRLPEPYSAHIIDVWGQTRDDWRVNRLALSRR